MGGFYLDERGGHNELGVFYEEESACKFLYELLVKANNDKLKEESYELESSSPWKGATLDELIQKLKDLQLRIEWRAYNLKWNLYICYLIHSSKKEMLIKTYTSEDTMCGFIYNYCLRKIEFEKELFSSDKDKI